VADFIATYTACQRILWAKHALTELGYNPKIILHQSLLKVLEILAEQSALHCVIT
jgi:hypothetical protein